MLFRRCAVGGQDYSHSGDGENLMCSLRLKEDLLIGTFRQHLQEFLIVLAICNTVVTNSHPHHDAMNSSGVIEEPEKNAEASGRFAIIFLHSIQNFQPPLFTICRVLLYLQKDCTLEEFNPIPGRPVVHVVHVVASCE